MSHENVELVYRGADTLNRRDLDGFLALVAEDVRFEPEPGVRGYDGHDGVRRAWKGVIEEIPDLAVEVVEVRDLRDDLTLALMRVRGVMRSKETPFDRTYWVAGGWRHGKAIWWGIFLREGDALEAAGLSEQAMSQANADSIRRAYDVWNESGPAAVVEQFWAEDAVYREGPGRPDAGVYRGRAAALARMRSLIDLVGPIEVRLDDLIEVGDGRFVACTSMAGQGANAPYTQSFAVVHRLRDGVIVEADYYLDRAQALRAVGLRE